MSDPVAGELVEILEESRRLGFLGSRPIDDVIDHARSFVSAITAVDGLGQTDRTVLDLGAGGGVPGLVIAHDLPCYIVTLLDRRRTRTDFLERVVRRLRWTDRVHVVTADATHPGPGEAGSFDWAVARGFGPPLVTLRAAARWVRPAGEILISEPPQGDRWSSTDLAAFGVQRRPSVARIARFHRC